MASGRTHARWATVTALGLTAWGMSAAMQGEGAAGLAVAAGGWLGWLIDPDLDHEQMRTHTEWRIYRTLGKWPGRLWQALWAPYGVLIPHRSPWSHMPVLGTLIRAAYLYAFICLIYILAAAPPPSLPGRSVAMLLGAWAIQDTVHLALDGWRMY